MSNNLSHTIRRFNRFELKYLVSLKQAEIFKAALRNYLDADEHSHGSYGLSSLYYDSPDFRCYWEKVDGIRFRRKLRIRHYENGAALTPSTPVFVEIKQRLDRVTQKRRVLMPYAEALALCNRRELPKKLAAEDEAVISEVCSYLWEYNLHPVSIVRYQRQAFMGTAYDLGLRVTFDTQLGYQVHQLRLQDATTLPMLSPDRAVMEIKVNERLPYWLADMIAAHNLRTVRVSKYCRSIDLANANMPAFSQLAFAGH